MMPDCDREGQSFLSTLTLIIESFSCTLFISERRLFFINERRFFFIKAVTSIADIRDIVIILRDV